MTDKIDTHGESDSRSVQAIPVKRVASQIEPTPPVLPQLSRLVGQSGHLQADGMKEADLRKKVLECEDSNRSFELKTVSIERYAVKDMAEFERIDFDPTSASSRIQI